MHEQQPHSLFMRTVWEIAPGAFLNLAKDSIPKNRDYVLFTFLSDKESKPDFVIHLVGKAHEFNELTKGVHSLEPVKILEALNSR
ncbi:MAG: hypothetical protein R2764_03930 [Bacteroidales bacterium]